MDSGPRKPRDDRRAPCADGDGIGIAAAPHIADIAPIIRPKPPGASAPSRPIHPDGSRKGPSARIGARIGESPGDHPGE